jgi:hypothetical protein
MHIFDITLRFIIQSVVLIGWGVFALAFVTGLIGRIIRFVWMKFHPVTTIVPIENDNVVDAEWVREV